jgi:hypothetical protein
MAAVVEIAAWGLRLPISGSSMSMSLKRRHWPGLVDVDGMGALQLPMSVLKAPAVLQEGSLTLRFALASALPQQGLRFGDVPGLRSLTRYAKS